MDAELAQPSGGGGGAPAIVAHDHVGRGPQRLGRGPVDRILVTGENHDVGGESHREQRVRAAVDADQDRSRRTDEAARPGQLIAVLMTLDHHQDGATGDRRAGGGDATAVQEQVLLSAQELTGVVREARQVGRHPVAGLLHLRRDRSTVQDHSGGDGDVLDVHDALVQAHRPAVLDRGEHAGTDPVDEHHPGGHQHLRAQGGVAPRDHRRHVDHGSDPGVDELVRAGAVEV